MFGAFSQIDGLFASSVAALISLAGILAVAAFGRSVEKNSSYFAAFAVGVLSVGVSFHLIPEALETSLISIAWVFGGFAVMVLVGIVVELSAGSKKNAEHSAALTFGYASIIALAFHSFLDGAIYAAAFQGEAFTGWITVSGLMLHEFPEGVIAYFMLASTGLSRLRVIFFAFIAASLTTVAGTLSTAGLLSVTMAMPPLTAMLGGAAGALIYVLIVHLAPHAAKAPDKKGYFYAQLGVIVSVAALILNSLGHTAGH